MFDWLELFFLTFAFQAILRDYAYSADSVLPATALRQALAALWKDMGRFQLVGGFFFIIINKRRNK